jgi:hypothetical protein
VSNENNKSSNKKKNKRKNVEQKQLPGIKAFSDEQQQKTMVILL